MYDLSGLKYRIIAVGGIIAALGILCLIFSAFWNPQKRDIKGVLISIVLLLTSVVYSSIYLYRISNPIVLSYSGYFCDERRDSRVAPPLPFTMAYTFSTTGKLDRTFYLDIFSKNTIFPREFDEEILYYIYYEKSTHIILKIEVSV